MSQRAADAPDKAEVLAMKARWEALPVVKQFTADMHAQVAAEGLELNEAGVTRAFQLARLWAAENGELPDSGLRAWG